MPPALVIRADASVAIGTGHVMRCLALSQAWQELCGTVVFVMAQSTAAIDGRLHEAGLEVVRLRVTSGSQEDGFETAQLAHARGAEWIVVDGYQFNGDYQLTLKNSKRNVLFLDDMGDCDRYFADFILNQNVHAQADTYANRDPGTKLLLGPRFAMLRREFSSWSHWRREFSAAANRILLSMGGSDPQNFTIEALRALDSVDGLEVTVVAGGSNPHVNTLRWYCDRSKFARRVAVDVTNMPELMAWADIAVSAAGSTCWEMCLLGLPAILVAVAEHQLPLAEQLHRRQISIHLGSSKSITGKAIAAAVSSLLSSQDRRREMSKRGRDLVDGLGARRVAEALLSAGRTNRVVGGTA